MNLDVYYSIFCNLKSLQNQCLVNRLSVRPNFKHLYAHISSASWRRFCLIWSMDHNADTHRSCHAWNQRRRQMVILLYLMVLCCFHSIRGRSESYSDGLGAYPWRTGTDATDLDKYRSPRPLETHLHQLLLWTLLWHKENAENVSKHDLWSSPVLFSTADCGQKKRGSWAQKGKRSLWILLHYLKKTNKQKNNNRWCFTLNVMNEY